LNHGFNINDSKSSKMKNEVNLNPTKICKNKMLIYGSNEEQITNGEQKGAGPSYEMNFAILSIFFTYFKYK
jgi:hypothetical protein